MKNAYSIFLLACLFTGALTFSIPGVSINSFVKGADIPLYANELDSIVAQYPFDYYSLSFCKPSKEDHLTHPEENLGSILLGDRHDLTPYKLHMQINTTCRQLCLVNLTETDINIFSWMIDLEYTVNFVVDNLPALYTYDKDLQKVGFPIGYVHENQYYIYNHIAFYLEYYKAPDSNQSRIVGFRAEPHSLGYVANIIMDEKLTETIVPWPQCTEGEMMNYQDSFPQKLEVNGSVLFTYDVFFIESNKTIGTRWDAYKLLGDEEIHWLSILNSSVINIILTCIIAHILRRTLRNDVRKYEELSRSEDLAEDSGWKQLSREVFRAPEASLFLSVFVGTGVQIGLMMLLTLFFACLGFTEKADRGSLLTIVILLFTFMGAFAGYYSARIYKMFKGSHWIQCTMLTVVAYPGANFIVFYIIDLMMTIERSSAAVSLSTILTLCSFWFGISAPLVFLGSLIGFKKQVIEVPAKPNPLAAVVPPQPWYLSTFFSCLLGGLLPFGAVFMELVFIMMSIWRHSFYYLFAFLFLVVIILIVTCAEISIVISYLQLCHGNHRIWWRSFLTTGSSAFYVFAYAIFYYFTQLNIHGFASTVLYFGYMALLSLTFFVFCGSVGFFASLIFVRKIYTMIKLD